MISTHRETGGFTLIELILVTVIISILAAMVVPNFTGVSDDAREAATKGDMVVIGNALDRYEIYYGSYPKSLNELLSAKRPLLKEDKVPVDHWDNPYLYSFPGRHNKDTFDLVSRGRDGIQGTEDDLSNWD